MRCPDCDGGCFKRECMPQFQADNLHLWRNKNGTRHSYAIGGEMPMDRQERRAIEKSRGIEFTSELTPKEKRIMEYREHVQSGGERLDPHVVNPEPIESKPLREYIREANARGIK